METMIITHENGILQIHLEPHHPLVPRIQEYVKKHFYEFYFGRNSIILYPDLSNDSTTLKRRHALLSQLFKKSSLPPLEQESLLAHYKKTVKFKIQPLEIALPRVAIPTVKLWKLSEERVALWLEEGASPWLFSSLKSLFLFSLLSYDESKRSLTLHTKAPGFKDSLRSLLAKRQVLGKRIELIYEEHHFKAFLEESSHSKTRTFESSLERIQKIRQARALFQLSPHELNEQRLKERYKTLARESHPDLRESSEKEEATERFLMIKEAYETLRNFLAQSPLARA